MEENKKNVTHNWTVRVSKKELDKFCKPSVKKKLMVAAKELTDKKYNESRLLRKIMVKMSKQPKEVLEFFNYEID